MLIHLLKWVCRIPSGEMLVIMSKTYLKVRIIAV